MRSLCEVRVRPHRTCSKINLSAWGKVRLVGGRWCAGKDWTKRWGYEDEEISGFGMNCFPQCHWPCPGVIYFQFLALALHHKLSSRSSSEPWHFCGYWSLEPATGSYWEQISKIFDYLQNMKSWETVLNVQNKARQYFSINYKSLQGSSNLCKFFKVHVSGQVDKAFWGPLDLQMSNLANMGRVLFMRCK